MNENEVLLKEIIFYLSACLDISIKAADCSGKNVPEGETNLKVLYDILITLQRLEKLYSDKNTQKHTRKNAKIVQ